MTIEELRKHHNLPQAEKDEKTYNYYYNKWSIEVLQEQIRYYKEELNTDMTDRIPRIITEVLKDKTRQEKLNLLGI